MKTVSASYLASYVESCVEQGANEASLLACIPGGLQDFRSHEGEVSETRYDADIIYQVLIRTEKQTGKADIGLLIGENLRPGSLNELGTAIMCCASLRQAIGVNCHYQALSQELGCTVLKTDASCAWVTWEPYYSDPEHARMFTDFIMAGQASFGRWLTWAHNQTPIAVHLRHERPNYSDAYAKMFDCPVLFSQAENAMLIELSALDLPLPQGNEVSLNEICKRLDLELAKLEPLRSYHEQVADLLQLDMTNGPLNLPQTARRLGVSPRSLRRCLAAEETSFRQILEQMRQQLCDKLLSENVPLLKIANQLGYSQQSAFNRAFKQWYGTTPKSYVQAKNHKPIVLNG